MKRTLLLLTCVVALTIGAAAQINFSNLPLVISPAPMPNGYAGFNWSNIFFVDPAQWSGAGPGYLLGPIRNQDVAFVGGSSCARLHEACSGSITLQASRPGLPQAAFHATSATVAAGFAPTGITVFAYSNGRYVGSAFYNVGMQLQTLYFPSWGGINQLTFQTDANGNLVFYQIQVEYVP